MKNKRQIKSKTKKTYKNKSKIKRKKSNIKTGGSLSEPRVKTTMNAILHPLRAFKQGLGLSRITPNNHKKIKKKESIINNILRTSKLIPILDHILEFGMSVPIPYAISYPATLYFSAMVPFSNLFPNIITQLSIVLIITSLVRKICINTYKYIKFKIEFGIINMTELKGKGSDGYDKWNTFNTIYICAHGELLDKGYVLPDNVSILTYNKIFQNSLINTGDICPLKGKMSYPFYEQDISFVDKNILELSVHGCKNNKVLLPNYKLIKSKTNMLDTEYMKPHIYDNNEITFDIDLYFKMEYPGKNGMMGILMYEDFFDEELLEKLYRCNNLEKPYEGDIEYSWDRTSTIHKAKAPHFFVKSPNLEGNKEYERLCDLLINHNLNIPLSYLITFFKERILPNKQLNFVIFACKSNDSFYKRASEFEHKYFDEANNSNGQNNFDEANNPIKLTKPLRMTSNNLDDADCSDYLRCTSSWLKNRDESGGLLYEPGTYLDYGNMKELFINSISNKELARNAVKLIDESKKMECSNSNTE